MIVDLKFVVELAVGVVEFVAGVDRYIMAAVAVDDVCIVFVVPILITHLAAAATDLMTAVGSYVQVVVCVVMVAVAMI